MRFISKAVILTAAFLPLGSLAQSSPTATQRLQLAGFFATTRTSTGLQDNSNLDITSGADLTLLAFRRVNPTVEVRGSYPFRSGSVIGQKNFLAGPKFEFPKKSIQPYVNFFVGRGRISYLDGGYIYGNLKYIRSDSLILSPGAGLNLYANRRTAVTLDFQYQYWSTPAAPSNRLDPKSISLGFTHNFDLNPHHLE
jgi:hypothetical protein